MLLQGQTRVFCRMIGVQCLRNYIHLFKWLKAKWGYKSNDRDNISIMATIKVSTKWKVTVQGCQAIFCHSKYPALMVNLSNKFGIVQQTLCSFIELSEKQSSSEDSAGRTYRFITNTRDDWQIRWPEKKQSILENLAHLFFNNFPLTLALLFWWSVNIFLLKIQCLGTPEVVHSSDDIIVIIMVTTKLLISSLRVPKHANGEGVSLNPHSLMAAAVTVDLCAWVFISF